MVHTKATFGRNHIPQHAGKMEQWQQMLSELQATDASSRVFSRVHKQSPHSCAAENSQDTVVVCPVMPCGAGSGRGRLAPRADRWRATPINGPEPHRSVPALVTAGLCWNFLIPVLHQTWQALAGLPHTSLHSM
ncbi:hypothetical protein DPEC_G00359450 [Dallia pectoralis]|uniref:Uncharacterized protein n=1 Tax=Dallia pectoralis TaxID=75939 RepID=A0ACC2F0J6_DALPE|nr:hypothetical protein DPEC_G00359450 [Dallia pectoralis]